MAAAGLQHTMLDEVAGLHKHTMLDEVRGFWGSLQEHEPDWVKPHLSAVTAETVQQVRNGHTKVDGSNPIWLEAPLKRLRMQMSRPVKDVQGSFFVFAAAGGPTSLEQERAVYEDIVDTLVSWNNRRVRDPEQFIVTLQQVLTHAYKNSVQGNARLAGLAQLMDVLEQRQLPQVEPLLQTWAFVLYEFDEMRQQLEPLLGFLREIQNSDKLQRLLKIILIYVQDTLPDVQVEGFSLYLLSQFKGALLRDFQDRLQSNDPDGELREYVQNRLFPLTDKAYGLVEAGVDNLVIKDMNARIRLCEDFLESDDTTPEVKEQIHRFLDEIRGPAAELNQLTMERMATFLGYDQIGREGPRLHIRPPPPLPHLVAMGLVSAPQAPLPPPPPPPGPVPSSYMVIQLGTTASQPTRSQTLGFLPRKFFIAVRTFCESVSRKQKWYPDTLKVAPAVLESYVIREAPQGCVWAIIKNRHLQTLQCDLEDLLLRIRATEELKSDEEKLQALVYMVKDLDTTPFVGGTEAGTVAALRWLVDGAYLLYRHSHGKDRFGGRRLIEQLCGSFTAAGIDPERRLRVWDTMLCFDQRHKEREETATRVQHDLRACFKDTRVREVLACTVMHARQVDASLPVSDPMDACRRVLKCFPLLRLMIDNLFKDYKGMLILDGVKQHLPLLKDLKTTLRQCSDNITTELDMISQELHGDLARARDSLVECQKAASEEDPDSELMEFSVEGRSFEIRAAQVPVNSFLGGLVHSDIGVSRDEDGRIELDADPVAFQHLADWLSRGEVPHGLSSEQWNELKMTGNFLGLESAMELLVETDHVYLSKVSEFLKVVKTKSASSISLGDPELAQSLELLLSLFRRLVDLYDNIDSKALTSMFGSAIGLRH